MNKNISGMIFAAVLLAGCATFKAQNCGENAGYQKGFNDARAGRLMSIDNFPLLCDKESAALAQKGYREGYQAGSDKGGAQMNVSFRGGKLGLEGANACQADFNGERFSDNAATEAQARAGVLAKCRARYPACPDTAVTCSKK
jgi:major membrane immunogen (membrane-anchored lipoprotein)